MDETCVGFVATGSFTHVSGLPEGCNPADSKLVFKWKDDGHEVIERDP